MTNKFTIFLEDIGKGISWPFAHIARLISILAVTLKDYPQVRAAVIGLIQQIETVSTDLTAAAAQGGLNPASDEAELAAAVALFKYVQTTFLPVVEAAYKAEITAVNTPQLTDPAETT